MMGSIGKKHIAEGEIRAYLDHALSEADSMRISGHLNGCRRCHQIANALTRRSEIVSVRLGSLSPEASEKPLPASIARTRLSQIVIQKENESMVKKIFHQHRTAWVLAALALILAVSMAFSPVRALATSFLGLFRVQQIAVVQVNPGDLPEQLGSSAQLQELISQNVKMQQDGQPVDVASANEASQIAGFNVRLPGGMNTSPTIEVQPSMHAEFTVDSQRMQALLNEIGQPDVKIPADLNGAVVTVDVARSVTASYGNCTFDQAQARQQGYDPDNPTTAQLPQCTTFVQVPSPEVNAPPGIDIEKLGEALLQVLGMSPEDAAHFSQNIDWTTTLVLPIPSYGTSYQDYTVDGVTGTLILQTGNGQSSQYMLMWVKDGIVYALTGPGGVSRVDPIARSIH
jgi:hypothetical protein